MPSRLHRRPRATFGPATTRAVVLVVTAAAVASTPASSAWAGTPSRPAAAWSDGTPSSIDGPAGRSNIPIPRQAPADVESVDTGAGAIPPDTGSDPTSAPAPTAPAPTTPDLTASADGTATTAPQEEPLGADGGTAGAVLAVDALTGVPAGTVLTPMTGNLTIKTPGYVLQNVDLQGCLVIKATDVVVRNSRITCGSPPGLAVIQTAPTAYRFTIEDSEVDGAGRAQIGLGYSNITARRVEVRNTVDGVRASWHVLLEDSWVHSMVRVGDLHPDAVQTTGGRDIVIRGNILNPMTSDSGDLMNAAIMIGSETSDTGLLDVLIENNVLDGGNYTVNMRGDTVFTNVVFRDNVFGTQFRYGPFQAPTGIVLEGANISVSTGVAVRVNPAR